MNIRDGIIATLVLAVVILWARDGCHDKDIDRLYGGCDPNLSARVDHLEYLADKYESKYIDAEWRIIQNEKDMLHLTLDFVQGRMEMDRDLALLRWRVTMMEYGFVRIHKDYQTAYQPLESSEF